MFRMFSQWLFSLILPEEIVEVSSTPTPEIEEDNTALVSPEENVEFSEINSQEIEEGTTGSVILEISEGTAAPDSLERIAEEIVEV